MSQLGKRRREIFPDRVKRAGLALNQFCVSTNEAWSRWQRWRPPRVLPFLLHCPNRHRAYSPQWRAIHSGEKAKLCRNARRQDKSPPSPSPSADKSSFQAMENRPGHVYCFGIERLRHPDCFAAIGAIDDDEVGPPSHPHPHPVADFAAANRLTSKQR